LLTLIDSWLIGKLQRDYGEIMQRIAIYDLDRTITRYPTYLRFLAYAVWRLQPWRIALIPIAMVGGIFYAFGAVDRARLKEFNFRLFLGSSVAQDRIAPVLSGFAGRNLSTNTLKAALDRIAADRAEGFRIVIATASFGFYIRPYATLIGIDDVIATGVQVESGALRPALDGENCYGPAKLRMVTDWFKAQGIARDSAFVRFYSDHSTDQHCLDWADEAFATNPHPPLRRLASQRGWQIFDWQRAG
jgi:HAD superfamily phosphoserine phosphatase-like hydrolase